MNAPADITKVLASAPDATLGYKSFTLGAFNFRRDEYFAHINWKTRDGRPLSHSMDISNFLRALMRDVAWGFFYGGVNFDHVIGTTNKYSTVDLYAGTFNGTMKAAGVDRLENFPTEQITATFQQMLDDWTNEGFDPFAAPLETGSPYGRKHGNNTAKITRARELATRCVGLKETSTCAPTNAARRSTAPLPTCRRTNPSCTPNPASRTRCTRSTCSPSCRAARSRGTRASPRW